MRRFCALLAALCLVAVACGDDDGTAGPTTSEPVGTTSTTEAAPTTTTAVVSAAAILAGGERCTAPEGFSIAHPPDWDAVSDCGQFGPLPLDEPEPGTDERTGVVSAFVDRVPFSEVAEPGPEERARAFTTVDGLQAVRVELVEGGDGLYPRGTEVVRWMIDLAIGPDDGPGTLFVDAVDVREEIPFDRAVMVLDAMARSLGVGVGDEPEEDPVIARFEGGGTPFVVAAAPAATMPTTCLRRIDADVELACVEEVTESDGIAMTALAGPTGPVATGIVGDGVWSVELSTVDSSMTYLPVPYPARESRAFAVPLDPSQVTDITLGIIDGTIVAEPDPSEARRPVR